MDSMRVIDSYYVLMEKSK